MNGFREWLAWQLRDKSPLGAYDLPDQRDYTPKKMFGGITNYPPQIYAGAVHINLLGRFYARNQGNIQNCTSQALTAGMQIQAEKGRYYFKKTDNLVGNHDVLPEELWQDQFVNYEGTYGTANAKLGDYLQNALKTARHRGVLSIIDGKLVVLKLKSYGSIKNSEVDAWLERGHTIFTGSEWVLGLNGGRYTSFNKYGFLFSKNESGVKKAGGHAFLLIGRTIEKSKIMLNSHGERWGLFKNGTAMINEKKLKECFTKYIFTLDWDHLENQLAVEDYRAREVDNYRTSRP